MIRKIRAPYFSTTVRPTPGISSSSAVVWGWLAAIASRARSEKMRKAGTPCRFASESRQARSAFSMAVCLAPAALALARGAGAGRGFASFGSEGSAASGFAFLFGFLGLFDRGTASISTGMSTGVEAPSSRPAGVIRALRELEARWNARKGEFPHFEDVDHPINLNIGMIEGGDWASSVPAWCAIDCRIAIYPGERPETMMRAIEDAVSAAARGDRFLANNPPRVSFTGFTTEGYVLEPGSEAEAVLARAHETATGEKLRDLVTPGYLDTRVYALYDRIPALCYGPISENIHGFDERFSITSMRRVTRAMALFVAEWCGTEPLSA